MRLKLAKVLATLLIGVMSPLNADAGQYLIFKGGAVSNNCIDALAPVPSGQLVNSQPLYFACLAIPYQEDDILVYDDGARRCQNFDEFSASNDTDIVNAFVEGAGSASLQQLVSDIFIVNDNALIAFDSFMSQVSLLQADSCSGVAGGGTGGGTGGGGTGGGTVTDSDGDGRSNSTDNCPTVANAGQEDGDGDGVGDVCDNCSARANPDQRDTNADGYGNICDADLNGDLTVNVLDLGLFKNVFLSADADADFNGDGTVNVLDLGEMRLLFFKPPGPSGLAP